MEGLVQYLKQAPGRQAVEDYITEGRRLGEAIAGGKVRDENQANNRQVALPLLGRD